MCVYCMWERLEPAFLMPRSVKTIMCSKLLASMSGLHASKEWGGGVATSQSNQGALNHVARPKKSISATGAQIQLKETFYTNTMISSSGSTRSRSFLAKSLDNDS